jgi:prepilin-type N-terminal cleavage/methylation domain-containing protein
MDKTTNGYTLIELLIVLAIVSIVLVLGTAAVAAVLHFGFHLF